MQKQLYIIIKGLVQGVFFRTTTKDLADSLNVKGFIKNNSDGTVEGIFEGNEKDLKKILNFCKTGPKKAKVKSIKFEWKKFTGKYKEFSYL